MRKKKTCCDLPLNRFESTGDRRFVDFDKSMPFMIDVNCTGPYNRRQLLINSLFIGNGKRPLCAPTKNSKKEERERKEKTNLKQK